MKQYLRKQLFRIHRIIGLLVGALLLLLSTTGAILVFSEEIDHSLHSNIYHITPGTQPKPLQELMNQARLSLRGNAPYLYFLRLPQEPQEPAVIRAEYSSDHKIYIYLNPYTGEVIHQHTGKGNLNGFLLYLHFTLLSGKTGATIILIGGILLLISVVTGILVYRKAISKVLFFRVKLEWHSRTRRWRNLHRIVGVWALLFNLLIAFTGIMIERKVLDARKKGDDTIATPALAVSYETLLSKARAQIPEFKPVSIRPPKKNGDPVRVLGHAREAAFWGLYSSSVFFDAHTGNVKKTVDFSQAPFTDKFNACIVPLHFGNYGGIPVKILYSLFALTPGLLSVSGFLIWYRRKYIIKTHQR
ncbi:MAG TPA: PepSY-associated TM helix domain-containing protein [Chitinophaga sp.]|uniref:PepSY-associated TM helix domain-containing protein n=1 Tax=Chitinophaga sp. TaxID=1869181 RepID=UPI002CC46980|nr:PepSY-associated TM helix domain-containing protein [Chitinophaga sp.]HVI47452.1 PepSY-associated TM helix domain-containing protein [Chitinophaga sp.]